MNESELLLRIDILTAADSTLNQLLNQFDELYPQIINDVTLHLAYLEKSQTQNKEAIKTSTREYKALQKAYKEL